MSRMFGWSLPPGCTSRMIDEQAGLYATCPICGSYADDCICPECPTCGEYGNPACYQDHGLVANMIQRLNAWINLSRHEEPYAGDDDPAWND